MIIFFENGRLGNQLFQYCAIRKLLPEDGFLAIGMQNLADNFTGVSFRNTSAWGRLLTWVVSRIGQKRLELLGRRLRLLTLVEEDRSSAGVRFDISTGLIRRLVYFKGGFYQSEGIINYNVAESIKLRTELDKRADEFLCRHPGGASDRYFVHVRRGDYITWPSADSPAVMPLAWYVEQMEHIRLNNPNAQFFVVSDDKPYIEEFFSKIRNAVIVEMDELGDFAIMTKCGGGGVLSASSYSWWAAYFVRREFSRAKFIAPMYWAGYRRKQWYPEAIQTSWIDYRN